MSRAWPGTGYVVAVGIGLVLGFLSAWFDSLPNRHAADRARRHTAAMLAMQQLLFGRPV